MSEDFIDTTADNMRRFGIGRISRGDAIKAKCLDCAGSRHEIRLCEVSTCALWPFRMGDDPWRAPREISDEQRQAAAERFAAYRSKQ